MQSDTLRVVSICGLAMGSLVDWGSLQLGQRIHFVARMVCHDLKGVECNHIVQSAERTAQQVRVRGSLPFAAGVVILDALVVSVSPVSVHVDATTQVLPVPSSPQGSLERVVEVCCGLGAFTSVLSHVNMQPVAGVDHNGIWASSYAKLHGQHVPFVVHDVGATETMVELASHGGFYCMLAAGVSCNAHSQLGGMDDPRSSSLPKTLNLGWLLQSVVILLECVPQMMQDAQVQAMLTSFARSTGYRLTQTVLRLSDAWVSRRDRWFALLMAPALGPCELPAMPQIGLCNVPRDLMPVYAKCSAEDLTQLQLNLYELAKYYRYSSGGMERQWFDLDAKTPTFLHSHGNALYMCACGCRQALSESRLQQRGLLGILVPLGQFLVHGNQQMEEARYLHPDEMWGLLGGDMNVDFGSNLRLAMAGIGQCVAPLTALWIFCHLRRHLDVFFGKAEVLDPVQVLTGYAKHVMAQCELKWPRPILPSVPVTVPESEHPDEDEPGLKGYHICVQWPQFETVPLSIKCSSVVAARQVLAAETQLHGVSSCQVAVPGVGMDLDLRLKSGMALDFRQLLLCVLVGMVRRLLAVIGMCMQ